MALSPSSSNPPTPWLETVYLLLMCLSYWTGYLYLLFCSVLFSLVVWHWTVVKEFACNDSSTYVYCKLLGKKTCLCCSIGHTTDGRETTVGIRRHVYCGRGGELKDGGPVFIYKYPYFCILSCKLCRNWQEQGCVFRFKKWGSKCNLKDSSALEVSHAWVPYVWSCGSRSTVISAQLKGLLITTRQMQKQPLLSVQGEVEHSWKWITAL